MAYDQELPGRIRQLIGSRPKLTEKKMFGGLAFLIAVTRLAAPPLFMSGPRSVQT
jgi:hypothetical protein